MDTRGKVRQNTQNLESVRLGDELKERKGSMFDLGQLEKIIVPLAKKKL